MKIPEKTLGILLIGGIVFTTVSCAPIIHEGGIKVNHDDFLNASFYSTEHWVLDFPNPYVRYDFSAAVYDNDKAPPKEITLFVTSSSTLDKEWVFLNDRQFLVSIDGDLLDESSLVKYSSKMAKDGLSEILTIPMPIGIVKKILSAKSAKMRLGSYDFDFYGGPIEQLSQLTRINTENTAISHVFQEQSYPLDINIPIDRTIGTNISSLEKTRFLSSLVKCLNYELQNGVSSIDMKIEKSSLEIHLQYRGDKKSIDMVKEQLSIELEERIANFYTSNTLNKDLLILPASSSISR